MANNITILVRADTAANWESKDSLLRLREIGYDQTNRRFKVGDGTTTWNNLPYVKPDVVNDLLTGGADAALSAEQGKELKRLVDGCAEDIETINQNITQIVADGLPKVVDKLESTNSGTDALSAKQGWVLKGLIPVVSQDTTFPSGSGNTAAQNQLKTQAFSAYNGNWIYNHAIYVEDVEHSLNNPNEGYDYAVLASDQGPVIKAMIDGLQTQINNLSTGGGGTAATISVGTVKTGAAGSSATVENVGTSSAAVLNFTIPRGATGAAGTTPTINVGSVTSGTTAKVTKGSQSTATNVYFDFVLPKGDAGTNNLDIFCRPGTAGAGYIKQEKTNSVDGLFLHWGTQYVSTTVTFNNQNIVRFTPTINFDYQTSGSNNFLLASIASFTWSDTSGTTGINNIIPTIVTASPPIPSSNYTQSSFKPNIFLYADFMSGVTNRTVNVSMYIHYLAIGK